jgi:hypothetical protein
MIIFIVPIILVAWFESSWLDWLVLWQVSVPLTWLVLIYLRVLNWVNNWQLLVLAAVAGYVLDTLASPKPGLVIVSMLASLAVGAWLIGRSKGRWQRLGSIMVSLWLYQLLLSLGMGWLGWWLLLVGCCWFAVLSIIVFGLMRLIGRRIEGWL